MSTLPFFSKSSSLSEVRNKAAVILYISQILIASTILFFSLLNPSEEFVLAITIGCIIVSIISLVLMRWNANRVFLFNLIAVIVLIIYGRLSIQYQDGLRYILLILQLGMIISAIMYFDYKKSILVPVVLILSTLIDSFFVASIQHAEMTTVAENDYLRITFVAILVFCFLLSFSGLFITHCKSLLTNLNQSSEALRISIKEIDKQHTELRSFLQKITDQSTTNSHKLRAPISRIEGLLSLNEALLDDDEDERVNLQIELNKSLEELRIELEVFERALCDAKAIIAKN